jgi:hypothetical protein
LLQRQARTLYHTHGCERVLLDYAERADEGGG